MILINIFYLEVSYCRVQTVNPMQTHDMVHKMNSKTHRTMGLREVLEEIWLYIYQKYQEKVKSADNMFCKMKQRYQLNKDHEDIDTPDVE